VNGMSRSIASTALPILAFLGTGLDLSPAAAQATELVPSGTWQVFEQGTRCQVNRRFGEAGAPVHLALSRGINPFGFSVAMAGPGSGSAEDATSAVLFGHGGQVSSVNFQRVARALPGEPVASGYFESLHPVLPTSPTATLQLSRGEDIITTFRLEDFATAMTELDRCQDRIYQRLALDGTALRAVAVPPQPVTSPATWVSSSDLPRQFNNMPRPLTVEMGLNLNSSGVPTNCTVLSSSGEPLLDLQSCRVLMARARYTPARDSNGAAVPAFVSRNIRWSPPGY
jgi:hypothetical protein